LVLALGFVVVDNYVLDGPVQGVTVEEMAVPEPVSPMQEARDVLQNSVAVLPFENLSLDPENAFFAAGIHEETLNQLVKLRHLSVISRTSVLRYQNSDLSIPEIAKELNVQTVLEGSVRYAGDRVRIAAQLIDAATDEHLWSEIYDRDFSDIFAIQSDIAMNIANALEAEFSLEEQASLENIPTDSPEAYALYLRAVSMPAGNGSTDSVRAAVLDLLNRAIAIDPTFALAYERIGRQMLVYNEQIARGPVESQALARENAEKALALDPNLGSAYVILARTHMLNKDAAGARRAFDRAMQLSPNDPSVLGLTAFFDALLGNYPDAIDLATRAAALSVAGNRQLASVLVLAREYQRARDVYEKQVARDPGNFIAHFQLSRLASQRGDYEEAVERARKSEQLLTVNSGSFILVYAYGLAGSHDDATRLFDEAKLVAVEESFVEPMMWAIAYLGTGQYEKALEQLEITASSPFDSGIMESAIIKVNAFSDPVLDEPRFVELRSKLGFQD
jgi:TolB-like protein/thioredoxin-like negative regulator of GroEL